MSKAKEQEHPEQEQVEQVRRSTELSSLGWKGTSIIYIFWQLMQHTKNFRTYTLDPSCSWHGFSVPPTDMASVGGHPVSSNISQQPSRSCPPPALGGKVAVERQSLGSQLSQHWFLVAQLDHWKIGRPWPWRCQVSWMRVMTLDPGRWGLSRLHRLMTSYLMVQFPRKTECFPFLLIGQLQCTKNVEEPEEKPWRESTIYKSNHHHTIMTATQSNLHATAPSTRIPSVPWPFSRKASPRWGSTSQPGEISGEYPDGIQRSHKHHWICML